jgi:hypothetical protein
MDQAFSDNMWDKEKNKNKNCVRPEGGHRRCPHAKESLQLPRPTVRVGPEFVSVLFKQGIEFPEDKQGVI